MSTNTESGAPTATMQPPVDGQRGKYLVFTLEPNSYAVPIQSVREIIAMHDVTPLPRMPEYVCGVINLRGRIIPVADLCNRLSATTHEPTPVSCTIVADLQREDDGLSTQIGCVVDSVCDVREIDDDAIQPTPPGNTEAHVAGLVHTDSGVVAVLDLWSLLGPIIDCTDEAA